MEEHLDGSAPSVQRTADEREVVRVGLGPCMARARCLYEAGHSGNDRHLWKVEAFILWTCLAGGSRRHMIGSRIDGVVTAVLLTARVVAIGFSARNWACRWTYLTCYHAERLPEGVCENFIQVLKLTGNGGNMGP